MAQIAVNNLTFTYEGGTEAVLEDVSFHVDTDWKLGLIGRNGKGKTTLLNLLMGKYEYTGTISANARFDYFPYAVSGRDLDKCAEELAGIWKPYVETWQILIQMNRIKADPECLYRPFGTLSHGERTRVMLAVLFAAEGEFLLIDEPTNHLDAVSREIVKAYLASQKGFILVSHDRDLLDAVCDHVLVMNRKTIEVQAGNFTSWWENKERSDAFARTENERHRQEIGKLKEAAARSGRWAEKSENRKIGFDPIKENDRSISSRSFIGAKTKKMQARVKSYEKRVDREIEEKEGLLQDIENPVDLKLKPLLFHKERLVDARDLSLRYEGAGHALLEGMDFQIRRGERVFLSGKNNGGMLRFPGPGSVGPVDHHQQGAVAAALPHQLDREVVIVPEYQVQAVVSHRGVAVDGQIAGSPVAVGPAFDDGQARQLAEHVIQRGANLAGSAAA